MQIWQVRSLSLIPYQQAWDLQNELARQVTSGEIPPTLLLVQHPHTYTFGRSGHASNLLWSEGELEKHGIQVYWVDRGGDVTYHGPGQLVGYPLVPLRTDDLIIKDGATTAHVPRADYTGYLRKLEEVLIQAMRDFGIKAERVKNLTGVWVNGAKLAAIGVKVDAHGVTRHGFALNVSPDMSYWDGIIGCGLAGYSVTSLARLLAEPPEMQDVISSMIRAFEAVFDARCEIVG